MIQTLESAVTKLEREFRAARLKDAAEAKKVRNDLKKQQAQFKEIRADLQLVNAKVAVLEAGATSQATRASAPGASDADKQLATLFATGNMAAAADLLKKQAAEVESAAHVDLIRLADTYLRWSAALIDSDPAGAYDILIKAANLRPDDLSLQIVVMAYAKATHDKANYIETSSRVVRAMKARLDAKPGNIEFALDFAAFSYEHASALASVADLDKCLKVELSAIKILLPLAAVARPDEKVLASLARGHNRSAWTFIYLERRLEAAAAFVKEFALRQRLADDYPKNVDYKRALARSHLRMAQVALGFDIAAPPVPRANGLLHLRKAMVIVQKLRSVISNDMSLARLQGEVALGLGTRRRRVD